MRLAFRSFLLGGGRVGGRVPLTCLSSKRSRPVDQAALNSGKLPSMSHIMDGHIGSHIGLYCGPLQSAH